MTMELPSTPDQRLPSVATPQGGVPVYCPVCETVPLTGKQQVCSAKCRIQKSMTKRAAKRAERDAKVRLLLGEALELLNEEASTLLEKPSTMKSGIR